MAELKAKYVDLVKIEQGVQVAPKMVTQIVQALIKTPTKTPVATVTSIDLTKEEEKAQ